MKNLVFILVSVFTFSFNANAFNFTTFNNGEVEILKEFKANKIQKKAIKKIRNYVTPRLLTGNPHTEALQGKKAKIQVNFDATGAVSNVTVIESDVRGLEDKFETLIKEFVSKNPSKDMGSVIQLEIPLVAKKYTL